MKFVETPLPGVYVIEVTRFEDERGFFARTYCRDTFLERGLPGEWPQCNVSFNTRRGTLRGMHYQEAPFEEPKLVRCTRGAMFDVALDLRRDSPTYGKWFGVELTGETRSALYIPKGLAHGFQTLTDACEVFYQMGALWRPDAARGVRWNDPRFGIAWPVADAILSPRDASYADYDDGQAGS